MIINNKVFILSNLLYLEAVTQMYSVKKVFLEILQSSQENTCVRASVLINFIKKETLSQVFSCEFCKIYKNTFSYRTTSVAASVYLCTSCDYCKNPP